MMYFVGIALYLAAFLLILNFGRLLANVIVVLVMAGGIGYVCLLIGRGAVDSWTELLLAAVLMGASAGVASLPLHLIALLDDISDRRSDRLEKRLVTLERELDIDPFARSETEKEPK